jgi:hypothetical protein
VSLSRKRKKELRKLQHQANTLWESQQVLIGQAGEVAREAGRQLGNYNREQVVPTVQHTYEKYAAPYVEQGVATSKKVYNDKVVPTAGALIGSALSVWDAANEKRQDLAAGRGFGSIDLAAIQKKADKYGKKATKQLSVSARRRAWAPVASSRSSSASPQRPEWSTPPGRRCAPTTSCGWRTTRCAPRMPDPLDRVRDAAAARAVSTSSCVSGPRHPASRRRRACSVCSLLTSSRHSWSRSPTTRICSR